jgi:hypothetical protein
VIKEIKTMAKCESIIRELRFVLEKELTHVYIFCEAVGDCPLGVQGWHFKTFAASVSAIDVLTMIGKGEEEYLLWPLNGPEH